MERRPRTPSFYPPREGKAQPVSLFAGKGAAPSKSEPSRPAAAVVSISAVEAPGIPQSGADAAEPLSPSVATPAPPLIAFRWRVLAIVVLGVACLLAYRNSFQSGWVLDNLYIIKYDPRTKADTWADNGGQPGVKQIFVQDYWWPKGISGLFRPVTTFTYWLNWTLERNGVNSGVAIIDAPLNGIFSSFNRLVADGKTPDGKTAISLKPDEKIADQKKFADARNDVPTDGFHWINLVLHITNAALVYLLMLRLTTRYWVSFFAALLFAMHPIATESVTNIIGRADMFAATTVVGGMLMYMSACRTTLAWKKVLWLTGLMILAGLGVFAKESAGAVVLVIIAYDLIYRLADRIRQLNVREWILALARGCTIAPLSFFAVCVFLLAILPRLAQMGNVAVPYFSASGLPNPPTEGQFQLDNAAPSSASRLQISDMASDRRSLVDELRDRRDAKSNIRATIKVVNAGDESKWAIFEISGPLVDRAALHSLEVKYLGGGASFPPGQPVMVTITDGRLGTTVFATIVGLGSLFLAFPLLATRRFSLVAIAVVVGAGLLLWTGSKFQPRYDLSPPGPGLAVIRWNLAPNPGDSDSIDAAKSALILKKPNPIIEKLRDVSLKGLAGSAIAFLLIEAIFATAWRESREDPVRLAKWRGFFDGYYVLLPVAVTMFVVRNWVFANATPAEEPFLDNPLRGLGFLPARLTAARVWGMLLCKLIWPVHLSADYSYNQIPLFGFAGVSVWQNFVTLFWVLALLATLAAAGWLLWRGHKALCFFVLLYLINYFPTSNFGPIIGSIMAERFMYLPLIGFAAIVAITVGAVSRRFHMPLDSRENGGARPARPNLVHLGLLLLAVAYGVRAYQRNKDWKSDLTLWTAAKKDSPNSFRSYQSYAFAVYEQFVKPPDERLMPEGRNVKIEDAIAADEQGMKIVDPLPDPNNSSRMYLHLGMYYALKGELENKNGPGAAGLSSEAVPWYRKSVGILERSVPIDRAFNQVNRARDVRRGKKPDQVADVGLAPVYTYLGISLARLGYLDEALKAYRYSRHLEPSDGDLYFKIASVYILKNQLDDAAAALVQAVILTPRHADAWRTLPEVFSHLGNDGVPAVTYGSDGAPHLNLSSRAMREAFVTAYRDWIRAFRKSKRDDMARAARDAAVNNYGFPPSLFDPLFNEPLAPVLPPDPVIYKPTTRPAWDLPAF